MYRQIKHYMLILLAFLLSSLSAIFSIGYIRYHLLIQANPLPDLIAQIQASPDYTPLHEVNEDFIDALLAIEDPTFYTHHGIVFANLLEAAITDFKEHSLLMGGSTITQQLSKNLFLDQRKTFQRKIAELFFVRDLERQYSKDEILELYINIIYFGDGYPSSVPRLLSNRPKTHFASTSYAIGRNPTSTCHLSAKRWHEVCQSTSTSSIGGNVSPSTYF